MKKIKKQHPKGCCFLFTIFYCLLYNYTNLYPHTENNKNDMPKYTHKNMPPRTTANPLPTPTSVAYIPSNRYEKKYHFC